MGLHYHDERRVNDPTYLPSVETFEVLPGESIPDEVGWYYWLCFPGCIPDGPPVGPFDDEEQALEHSRLDLEEDNVLNSK